MSNLTIEEKRKVLLERFTLKHDNFLRFNKFSGPGLKRKFQRLIFYPDIYIPYVLRKSGITKGRSKKVKLFWGKEIYVNTNDEYGFYLALLGLLFNELEYKLTKFFIRNLQESDVFYDVGANYGFYTYLALEFCREVHSFEPQPQVFKYLEMTLKSISNVHLNNLALSDKEGEIEMFVSSDSRSGESSILKDWVGKVDKKIQVKTITVDSYIASGRSKPTVLKIDAEGAESLIIDGGIEFFKNNNPIISMEVWSKNSLREISMRAVKKLRNLGYKPYFINLDGELEKVEGELMEIIKNEVENFIFFK